jgi:hypothetical protein
MAGYQRMMTALRRGQPDRVPIWELIVDRPVIEALYGDISYHEFVEREGLDGVTVFEDQRIEELGNSLSRDEWGIVWRVDTPGIPYRIAGPIKSQADLDGYVPPDPDADHRLKTLEAAVKRFKGERAIEIGADIGLTGDDYANRLGPLWSILDGLIDTGLHALDPLEPIAHMDIGEVKRRYGDRIAVAGNVDCGELLCRGSVEEVVEAVKETIAKAAPGGGHIVASSNSIHPGVKPQNYRAMLEAGRRLGTYPLDSNTVARYRERSYIARYGDR